MSNRTDLDRRVAEYWDWIAVALFLLVSVDLLTTMGAAAAFGVDGEGNPVVAWLLSNSLELLVAVNLAVVVLATAFFYALVESLRSRPRGRYVALGFEAWLGSLVAVGLWVLANNLAVIVHGTSLL